MFFFTVDKHLHNRIRNNNLLQFWINTLILIFLIFSQCVRCIDLTDITENSDYIIENEFSNQKSNHINNRIKKTYPIDVNNIVSLTESTPVKDSLPYNHMLAYKFEPNTESEWTHSYQILVYISASLCQLPDGWNTNSSLNGLSLYYTFNETVASRGYIDQMKSVSFENGYAGDLAEEQMEDGVSNYTLYMMVLPDECDTCLNDSTWVYEFAVSQQNLLFLYDTDPYISVIDVDYDSVIFGIDDIKFGSNRSYGLYLFEDGSGMPIGLNQSWCAISSSVDYGSKIDISENTTLSFENAFIVSGLEISKKYLAVMVVTFTNIPYGGGVFKQYEFTTSTSKACKLAYNLDFCNEVAYSIPVSTDYYNGDETWEQMISAYDNYTEGLYSPFEYAMQQIPCDTELDARYSPIRTCDDCKYSYKQWLCSVTIPRCVSQSYAGAQNKLYDAGTGRNSFIADTINPPIEYAEILPCLNVCQAIVRDCPSDFGFQCPSDAELVRLSYGDPTINNSNVSLDNGVSISTNSLGSAETYRVCNYMGEKNYPNQTSTG